MEGKMYYSFLPIRPSTTYYLLKRRDPVVKAFACGAEGHRFKPHSGQRLKNSHCSHSSNKYLFNQFIYLFILFYFIYLFFFFSEKSKGSISSSLNTALMKHCAMLVLFLYHRRQSKKTKKLLETIKFQLATFCIKYLI